MNNQIKTKPIVCLITPGHLCNCPRLIKEATALNNSGYQIHIICTSYMPYLEMHDQIIIEQNPEWKIDCKNWASLTFYGIFIKIMHQLNKLIYQLIPLKKLLPTLLNRNFSWQLKQAKKIKANLYIAHSAGAIAVAALAANKINSPFSFDAEDFHTGEDLSDDLIDIIDKIQEQYLPQTSYITAASPQIANAYKDLVKKPVHTILNVFPTPNFQVQKRVQKPLKLFWFSQTIGRGRGLEWVLAALGNFKPNEIELHLLGNLRPTDRLFFDELSYHYQIAPKIIHFHDTIAENQLLSFAAQFDIGLSLETGKPLNRDLCLSNKLFIYIQAGLGVIASDTLAQKEFLCPHYNGTLLMPLNQPEKLREILRFLIENPSKVLEMRNYNDLLSKEQLNWEIEQVKFTSIVSECLTVK